MSFYDNHYYHLNKRLLSIIGQWPYQSRLESNMMFGITLFFTGSLTFLEGWGLVSGITDLSIIMENASPMLVNIFIFVKLLNYFFNKYKMKELLDHVEETWKMMQVGPRNEILRSYAEQNKVYTIRYTLALYTMWILYSTTPLIVSWTYKLLPINATYTARFLYRLEHVCDVDKYFNLLMLHGFISVFYIVSVPIAVDAMFILCIQHVCALFEIIKYDMERIQGSDFVTLEPDIADDIGYHKIIECIKLHDQAFKFSELLSFAYATSYLFLLGSVIICISFSSAELLMVDLQFDEIARFSASNIAQLLHIYYLSWMCQRLLDYSGDLHKVIYSCNWYTISMRSRQLLKFMLMRATKPCQIKAGKMYVMSMENFSSILQVSVSYFTMLTSLQ
ncbi:odorant receptor 13a [Harpegnathos saltator]|uniref:odorant receptor 13a n=1 Tax=Harpegnathos saltator TaxID=610380 RepID=UPI000DBED446|nr:odorant receptor 13a [Harpegnathos saltator]